MKRVLNLRLCQWLQNVGWKGSNSAVLHAQLWAADGLTTLCSTQMRTRFQWNRVPWSNPCLSNSLSMTQLHMSAWLCLSFHYNTNWQPCELMKCEQCQQHLCIIIKFSILINILQPCSVIRAVHKYQWKIIFQPCEVICYYLCS